MLHRLLKGDKLKGIQEQLQRELRQEDSERNNDKHGIIIKTRVTMCTHLKNIPD